MFIVNYYLNKVGFTFKALISLVMNADAKTAFFTLGKDKGFRAAFLNISLTQHMDSSVLSKHIFYPKD